MRSGVDREQVRADLRLAATSPDVSATNRPAGRIASISAGVRSSIIALLSVHPFCRRRALSEHREPAAQPASAYAIGHVAASRVLRVAHPCRVRSAALAAGRLGRSSTRGAGHSSGPVPRRPRRRSSAAAAHAARPRARHGPRPSRRLVVGRPRVRRLARLDHLARLLQPGVVVSGVVVTILVGVAPVLARALAAVPRRGDAGDDAEFERLPPSRRARRVPDARADAARRPPFDDGDGRSSSCARSATRPRASPAASVVRFGGPRPPWQNGCLCPDQALPQGSPLRAMPIGRGHTTSSIQIRGRPVAAAES